MTTAKERRREQATARIQRFSREMRGVGVAGYQVDAWVTVAKWQRRNDLKVEKPTLPASYYPGLAAAVRTMDLNPVDAFKAAIGR